jgi:hypothetical protein
MQIEFASFFVLFFFQKSCDKKFSQQKKVIKRATTLVTLNYTANILCDKEEEEERPYIADQSSFICNLAEKRFFKI